jgi:hypothetical protein
VVPLGPESDGRFHHVVGFGSAEDLAGDVRECGVHSVPLGTGMNPSLLRMRQNHIAGAVTVAHRVSPE